MDMARRSCRFSSNSDGLSVTANTSNRDCNAYHIDANNCIQVIPINLMDIQIFEQASGATTTPIFFLPACVSVAR